MSHKVFVYGTLKKGCSNHQLMNGSHFVRHVRTKPMYNLFNLGAYPGLQKGGLARIAGEIYEVNDSTLDRLDWFEGHPHLFERLPIEAEDYEGEVLWGYIYKGNTGGKNIVLSGEWLDSASTL